MLTLHEGNFQAVDASEILMPQKLCR